MNRRNQGVRGTPRPRRMPNKTSTRPKRAARNPLVGFTRTFRAETNLPLNNTQGDNSYGERRLILNPTGLAGFNNIATTFDHYRVTRVRVFLRHAYPTQATANNGQLPRNASCSTIFWNAVDYSLLSSAAASTPDSIRNMQNSRSFLVPANQQVKVADFRPRVTSRFDSSAGTDVIRPISTWVPTNSLVTWSGLRVLAQNTNGAILFPNPSLQQVVTLSISVDVQFRQPQLSNTPTTFVSGRFFAPCHDDDTSDVDDLSPHCVDEVGDNMEDNVEPQKQLEDVDPPKYNPPSTRIFN